MDCNNCCSEELDFEDLARYKIFSKVEKNIFDFYNKICEVLKVNKPKLEIVSKKDIGKKIILGELYCEDNIIKINKTGHKSIDDMHDTICHELAHLNIKRHGKAHRELTKKYCSKTSFILYNL